MFLKNGVLQGSPISPALFNIYIEDMIDKLNKNKLLKKFFYKFYADDFYAQIESID